MFNLEDWLVEIVGKIRGHFCKRVVFIGLQGSYKRGEATAASDVDLVVILDELRIEDLKAYREIVRSMPDYEKACGFISGRAELQNWSKSDLFQFYFETEALFGNIDDVISPPCLNDIRTAIKMASETLYHTTIHTFVFDKNISERLESLYKMTFFILQAEYFLKNGVYVATKKELLPLLDGADHEILQTCINRELIKNGFEELYDKLINWCSVRICT